MGTPGPKPRPALIITVFEDLAPQYSILVAYGTSKKTTHLRTGEFVISSKHPAAYKLSGLSYDTKFDLGKTVELPYSSQWFAIAPGKPFGQTPKLGVLHPSLTKTVAAAYRAANP
jgi:hypothetical protein